MFMSCNVSPDIENSDRIVSRPSLLYNIAEISQADVAQLVEQRFRKP